MVICQANFTKALSRWDKMLIETKLQTSLESPRDEKKLTLKTII